MGEGLTLMVRGGGYRGEDCRVDSTLHCVEHGVEMKEGTHELRDGQ